MFISTLDQLRCPAPAKKKLCQGEFTLISERTAAHDRTEVLRGELRCKSCRRSFPILAGVAILVPDVRAYLLGHAKGIGALVPDADIPAAYRSEFREAKAEALAEAAEHIEEDLEGERVNALYFMNHYLRTTSDPQNWWAPEAEPGSPLIAELVKKFWDAGPFAEIGKWRESQSSPPKRWVELGCGVGGLARALASRATASRATASRATASRATASLATASRDLEYLGVDSSFASIALARHLLRGGPSSATVKIPEDLLAGGVSREVDLAALQVRISSDEVGRLDFVVGEAERAPVIQASWEVCVSLNMIDMLERPEALPKMQAALLREDGVAIQSGPYIWHPGIAKNLRRQFPKARTSAEVVRQMYAAENLVIREERAHLPWLFFKHVRQLEIYSVHLIFAAKSPSATRA